ncbi:thioredoxin [Haploplasma axanthum]|uniref:Thioredoxin n=1 Tax=Haploplasma axanthum TaxID=29552 RepID=A0A449BEE2_HAPAX|nr:thioredoxin [Haploplasma axanthum]VEU80792.1 Thioredoxin [Haploplasma axanthum]
MHEYQGQPIDELVGSGKPVLIQYYADWCGPCQMLKPVLEELSKEITDVTFYRVNIESYRDLAVSAGIQSIPTVVVYKDGKEKVREAGFKPKHLMETWIKANK